MSNIWDLKRFVRQFFHFFYYFVGLFGLVVAIAVTLLEDKSKLVIAVSGSFIFLIALAKVFDEQLKDRWKRVSMKAYADWTDAPSKYHIDRILRRMKRGECLEIFARTAFKWLCGDERDIDNRPLRYVQERSRRQDEIRKVMSKSDLSVIVSIVLQCPEVKMHWWAQQPAKVQKNREHFYESVKSFVQIRNGLQDSQANRFMLRITKMPIPNSMARVISPDQGNNRVRLLFVDLGDPSFLSEQDDTVKPFVVFSSRKSTITHYGELISDYLDSAPGCSECQADCPMKDVI